MSPQPISPEIIGSGTEKIMLYGDPGVGKTHCALTLPKPIYYICTGGPDELQTFYGKSFQDKWGKDFGPNDLLIDSVDLTFSWKLGTADGFDQVKKFIEDAYIMEQKGEIAFNSIVIDNITTLTELQIEKAIKLTNLSKPAESKGKSTQEKFDETGVLQVADYEWKDVMNMMQKFLSELFTLNKNICIVAHAWEEYSQDRATKQKTLTQIKPLFIGKQRDLIANLFSNVWYLYPNGQMSAARTVNQEQNPAIIAKTRVGGILPADWGDPNLSQAIDKFRRHAESIKAKVK